MPEQKPATTQIVGSEIIEGTLALSVLVKVPMPGPIAMPEPVQAPVEQPEQKPARQKPAQTKSRAEVEAEADPLGTKATGEWGLATKGKQRGVAHRVLAAGEVVYVGGDFDLLLSRDGQKKRRTNLAAFVRATGEPNDFAPDIDGDVRALAIDGQTLYVGGDFETVDGQPRSKLAAFDVNTGELLPFSAPEIDRPIRALAVADGRLYVGGFFEMIGDEQRWRIAAFDIITGELDDKFTPRPNDKVAAIVPTPDGIWIGGTFDRIARDRQRGLALVDAKRGRRLESPAASHDVIDLAADSDRLYAAIGGPGGRAMAVNMATLAVDWEIPSDGNFQAVAVCEGACVYFGGHYETVDGDERADRLTRHDKLTGTMDTAWLPQVNGMRSINAVYVDPLGIVTGGDFTRFGGAAHPGFAIANGATV